MRPIKKDPVPWNKQGNSDLQLFGIYLLAINKLCYLNPSVGESIAVYALLVTGITDLCGSVAGVFFFYLLTAIRGRGIHTVFYFCDLFITIMC